MTKFSEGDIVKLAVRDRTVIVTKVFPEGCGVWALYRNALGEIDARGYSKEFLGEIVGHISLDVINNSLKGFEV